MDCHHRSLITSCVHSLYPFICNHRLGEYIVYIGVDILYISVTVNRRCCSLPYIYIYLRIYFDYDLYPVVSCAPQYYYSYILLISHSMPADFWEDGGDPSWVCYVDSSVLPRLIMFRSLKSISVDSIDWIDALLSFVPGNFPRLFSAVNYIFIFLIEITNILHPLGYI